MPAKVERGIMSIITIYFIIVGAFLFFYAGLMKGYSKGFHDAQELWERMKPNQKKKKEEESEEE